MKMKWHSMRIWTNLWRQFAVPAALCVLLSASYFWNSSVIAGTASAGVRTALDNLSGNLWGAIFLTTAVCCFPWKRSLWRNLCAGLLAAAWLAVNCIWPMGYAALSGVMLCSLALCLHFASREDQPLRLCSIAGWFFSCLGISVVIAGAVTLISSAVTSLFLADYGSSDILNVLLTYLFFTGAPWYFLGGVMDCNGTRYGKFSAKLLLPLYLLLMAVLLAYVGKILFTWTMPVGTMNPFAIIAGVCYLYFHLTLTGDESRLSAWFRRRGAWLMAPVLLAQGIGVYIRADAYGLTASRIMGMGVTALCIAAVVSGLLRRRAKWLLIAAACTALVLPTIAEHGAVMNQEHRLEAALARNGMIAEDGSIIAGQNVSMDDQEIIWSAFDYLQDNDKHDSSLIARMDRQIRDGREQLPEGESHPAILLDGDIEALLGFEKPGRFQADSRYHTWWGSASAAELDTEGFRHAQWLDVSMDYRLDIGGESRIRQSGHEGVTINCDLLVLIDALNAQEAPMIYQGTALKISIGGEEADLTPLLDKLEQDDDGKWLISPESDRVTLPSGKVLHIELIRVYDYRNSDGVRHASVTVKGWLLTPSDAQ